MKLSKSIIKRYGITKKAWAVARGQKKTEVKPMARKRKSKRSFAGFARKTARRGGVGNSAALLQIDAMIYGAVRGKVSDAIEPLSSKIPVPYGLSDEVAMGLLLWGVSKYAKGGMLGQVARKGLVIENARVGEAIANGVMGSSTQTASSSTYSYG